MELSKSHTFPYFIAQKYDWDCGIVAVLNVIIWVRDAPLYNIGRSWNSVKRRLKTDANGTYDEDMNECLKYYGRQFCFRVQMVDRDLRDTVPSLLRSNNHVILAHVDDYGDWHYSNWFMSSNKVVGLNSKLNTVVTRYNDMTEILRFIDISNNREDGKPIAFVISK